LPLTLTPNTIRFPRAIFFSPATSSDSQLIAFKFQQVVLPGSASYQFFGGCAEGSRTNLVEFASLFISILVVVVDAGIGFVDVSVQEEAEPGNG
jgi:hypothetical protein